MDLRVEVGNSFICDNRHYKAAIMVISEMSKSVRILPGETDVAASSSLSPGDDNSQILYKRYKTNFIVKLLGQWQDVESGGHSIPVGGLSYYISPPRDMLEIARDPFHTIFYILFVLISCALFSKTWCEVSGSSANDVAKNLRDQGYFIQGHRDDSTKDVFKRSIPIAATFGGMCIGALTIFADFVGAIGSGTGILLAVGIVYSMYEEIIKKEGQ